MNNSTETLIALCGYIVDNIGNFEIQKQQYKNIELTAETCNGNQRAHYDLTRTRRQDSFYIHVYIMII